MIQKLHQRSGIYKLHDYQFQEKPRIQINKYIFIFILTSTIEKVPFDLILDIMHLKCAQKLLKRCQDYVSDVQVLYFDFDVNLICKYQSKQKMENINSFLQTLAVGNLYHNILANSLNVYSIRLMKLENLSPTQVSQHLDNLQRKDKENKISPSNELSSSHYDTWNNNQFKIFSWISVCYSYLKKKAFAQFEKQDYQFLEVAFPLKSRQFISYNIKILSKGASIRRSKWSQEEIDLLKIIMKEYSDHYKWTSISFQLYVKSNGLFLQIPQQCREQWINHLNPIVKKQNWTLAQDVLLLKLVVREGKKWSSISKMFDGARTEHMVKNRYKSIIHKNQPKAKKMCQKKLSENILMILEQKLKQIQPNYLKKKQRNGKQEYETTEQKNIIQIENQTQSIIKSIKDQQPQMKSDDDVDKFQLEVVEIKKQMNTWSTEMMNLEDQNMIKTVEDIYISSLLL